MDKASITGLTNRIDEIKQKIVVHSVDVFVNGTPETVRALTTVLNHYVTTKYARIARTSADDDLEYYDTVVETICNVIEVVVLLSELHNTLDDLENFLYKAKIG